jgi:SEL1 protein
MYRKNVIKILIIFQLFISIVICTKQQNQEELDELDTKIKFNKNKENSIELKETEAKKFNDNNKESIKNDFENIEELIQTKQEEPTDTNTDTNILLEETIIKTKEEILTDYETQTDYDNGMLLLNNTHGEKDYKLAYYYLQKAANKGHVKANEEIAIAMLFGDHMPRNITGAINKFQELSLSKSTSPRAQFYLGFIYASGLGVKSNQAKALTYFTFAAFGGEPLAQMALGYRYWSAINVATNCDMALNFYRKVATSVASRVSANSIGTVIHRIRLYDEEEKITGQSQTMLDDDLVQYYQLLADRGDTQAQYGLGLLHYQGARGLNMQYDKALHYFSRAAESGNNYAMAYLGKLYLEGGPHIKQDNATAIRYFKMAADKNNPIGQAGLGTVYLYGQGVDQDYAKALKYFQLSADQGYVEGKKKFFFFLNIFIFSIFIIKRSFSTWYNVL